jgi:ABC-type Fe3+-hydroxamate transport system substrate-binding protein
MRRAAIYGIIAAVVIAAGVGVAVAFAAMSMSTPPTATTNPPSDSNNNEVRVIKHAAGETEITGIPQRVIPLDTVAVEVLLSLGIEPVGAASLEEHKNWSPEISTKWPDVTDVGETWEPNFEVMAQLEPDLIIGMQSAHSEMYDELSDIAPTILLDNWPPEDGPTMLEAVEQNTMMIADILDRHDDGVAFLENFNAKLDQNERKLEATNLNGAKFILADVSVFEGDPRLRLYVPNAQGSETLERMGLENVVTPPEEFERFGSIDSSLEALATLDEPDLHFIYMQIPGEDPLTDPNYWGDSPVWKNLQFVKEGQVYPVGSINMFRGVLMLEKLADKATEALTNGGGEVRTISHSMGETEITGIPERVVVMDIVTLETFLHLGVQPVGLSSLDIQKMWNPEISTEWPDVVDVGNTYEPNLEAIAQLEPDLIFASESEHSQMYDDLSSIAPTIMLNNWPYEDGSTMLQAVEQNIMTISDIMGRSEDGVAYLEGFNEKVQEYKNRIDAAGLAGSKFILANPVAFEGEASLFLFVPNSQNSEILERMGLENAVSLSEEFARYGHTEVSLEALAALDSPDVHFIYVTSPGGGDPVTDLEHWKNHPVWTGLSFVQDGRVYHIEQINMFRGPIELEKLADSTIEALTGTS